jgi:hypothetical protein
MMLNTKHESGCYSIGARNYSIGAREVILVNPIERTWNENNFVLWFGAYGSLYLRVWADCLESALEEATDWIVEHAPGLLHDDAVQEMYEEAIAEGKSEEEAQEEAEVDMTVMGHNGIHYLASWEWGIALENPSRAELAAFIGEDE